MGRQNFDPARAQVTLFDALLRIAKERGVNTPILEDHDRKVLTYRDLIRAAFALGGKIKGLTKKGERVGVMLPTGVGCTVVFFALHVVGRVPVMLNFTSGAMNMRSALEAAGVKRILTAHRFIETAKLEDVVASLSEQAEITYLEQVRETIGLADKLSAVLKAALPSSFRARTHHDDPGVILFTSGSFGAPRGAVLSHENLVANVEQINAHIAFEPDWVFFNPLPMFHCYGLTGGTLLPLLSGRKAFLYPSPLHVRDIPKLIAECGANVLLATDTFAAQYARSAGKGELSSLKFCVLGAERVKPETRDLFRKKFGEVDLLEGYGATEASPVIAVNSPIANRHGTVGQILPGIEWKLEEVPGISEGQKLIVRGANVMKGYLNPNAPGGIDPLPEGWHDTGDVVNVDEESFVTIKGRVKRFAKVGGEMVSLNAVEGIAAQIWPEHHHAAVSVPCARKGEKVVLISDNPNAELTQLIHWAQEKGAPEIALPKKIIKITEIPVLGTGKTDYQTIQKMACESADSQEAA
jgi:acyl-[acyl-carrier-protein]-phospholipid O-acyltransferase/long-chain-fatty-acid--[acyl-carrier-protein] ligase